MIINETVKMEAMNKGYFLNRDPPSLVNVDRGKSPKPRFGSGKGRKR